MIETLYERHNDIVGNRAFEFDASFHTIRNDIRVLELESPIYTRMGARWRRVHSGSESTATAMADSLPAGTADECVQCFG